MRWSRSSQVVAAAPAPLAEVRPAIVAELDQGDARPSRAKAIAEAIARQGEGRRADRRRRSPAPA